MFSNEITWCVKSMKLTCRFDLYSSTSGSREDIQQTSKIII